jgi:hypothetical protein
MASRVQKSARTKSIRGEPQMKAKLRRATRRLAIAVHAAAACTLLSNTAAGAEKSADDWQYGLAIYGYFPDIGGEARFAAGNGASLDVSAHDLIDHLKFATMFSFAAQKQQWGFFTDVIYLDVGDSVSNSRAIGAASVPLPPGVTADGSLDLKGWVWTLAGNYRAIATPETNSFVDVFGGARLLDMKSELSWSFSQEFGPFTGPFRAGDADADRHSWDGIVGAKGRAGFGDRGRWFVPWYVDVGTGNADLTYQLSTGIGYSADWGDVFATWRYLRYDFSGNRKLENLDFNGPAVGVAFHF